MLKHREELEALATYLEEFDPDKSGLEFCMRSWDTCAISFLPVAYPDTEFVLGDFGEVFSGIDRYFNFSGFTSLRLFGVHRGMTPGEVAARIRGVLNDDERKG